MSSARKACNDTTNQSLLYTMYQRGRVCDNNLRTNRQPRPHVLIQTWPISHRVPIIALKISKFQEANLPPGTMTPFGKTGQICLSTVLTVDDELQTVNISWLLNVMNIKTESINMDFVRDIFDI